MTNNMDQPSVRTVKAATGRKLPARQLAAEEPADQHGVRSVQRALDILSLLTDDRPAVSIREIVDSTGLAKTTVLRLVATLEQSGLLWATASGYMAGPGLWRWAHLRQDGT